jgi:CDP-glucose 4,6-dehydratase
LSGSLASHLFDIRDRDRLDGLLTTFRPDVVIHLAAQALVRASYRIPFETFDVNIRGTLTLLDALRVAGGSPTVLIVTSDKVYRNDERGGAFRESDALGGDDPYSASKAACEIAVHAFAGAASLRLATARGGNVVGGGDYAEDRLLPDAIRAHLSKHALVVRHPGATRPWQHVLDTVFGYLRFAERLADHSWEAPTALNFGPAGPVLSVEHALDIFADALGSPIDRRVSEKSGPSEKRALALDIEQTRIRLGFENLLSQQDAIRWAGEWYAQVHGGENAISVTHKQIERYWAQCEKVRCAS